MNHSGGRLQVVRSRKTACEPAPPTPSTHANVQTSKVSPPRTALLTNLPCRTRQGNTRPILVHPGAPPARAKILSHARSSAERHPCAASLAHSPPPSCHVEAVGQHRGQDAAHPHCQLPRDVVAPLCFAPSPLQLPVGRPAPSNGSRLRSHATPQCCGAGPSRTDTRNAPWMLPRLYISLGWGSPALMCTGRSTTRN